MHRIFLNKRATLIFLLTLCFISFSTFIYFINNTNVNTVYARDSLGSSSLAHWFVSNFGFTPRNLTAELLRVDSQKWRQLLEAEMTSSKVFSRQEISQYGAGFDGKFDDVKKLEPGPYLPNYANPCWYEEMNMSNSSSLYGNNCLIRKGKLFTRLTFKTLKQCLEKMEIQEGYMKSLGRTWRMRCLPKVLLIGADKCGTSALTLYIQDHPLMTKGAFKEIRYWTNFVNTCLSPLSDWADMYDKGSEKIRTTIVPPEGNADLPYHPTLALDPTPSTYKQYLCQGYYKYHHGCSGERLSIAYIIKKIIPDAKIIAMVRNPVDRVYSSYHFTSARHDNRTVSEKTFDKDVKEFIDLFQMCVGENSVELCAAGRGYGDKITEQQRTVFLGAIYSVHFRHFLQAFGRENMKVVTLEDFAREPKRIRDDIFAFLGLPGTERFYDRGVINGGPQREPMMMKTRVELSQFYKQFNQQFEAMFGISYDV